MASIKELVRDRRLQEPGAMTLAQKLIARACGRERVEVGEIVNCKVDLAMFHDSSGPRRLKPMLEELSTQIWDRDRVVLVMDHYVPERDDDARRIVRIAREWASEQALAHVYDSIGICHVVLAQHGHVRPGMLCVGGDSHSSTGGAFGAYMFGIGSTEMLGVVVTGEIWLRVPRTIRMRWDGSLSAGVTAKDMMLDMIGRFGMNGGQYQAVEYHGSAIRRLSMAERMTLSNMSAELGAQVGLVEPDETTADYLLQAGVPAGEIDLATWYSDEDAEFEERRFDATTLEPQIAAPHSPANVSGISAHAGEPIDVAYVGACTGAKIEDLRAVARVLRNHRVAPGVRLLLAPASLQDQATAASEGVLQQILDAGAELLPTACGACAGYGGTLGDEVSVISTTARNFRGRMGSPKASVFLGSPFSVAAAALRGRITDPREVL
ncbi:MAG: 3-isopropylmalate dehydratase large subunit [Pirellulales bacterium]